MLAEFIDPAVLGFILIGVMLFSIFVGFPISFTLIFLGFVFGYLGFGKLVFYLMTLQFSMVMTEQTLAAVPLFVFMGIMMEQAGLMERLFSAFQLMLAKVRGSLYYAVLFVSVVFAAATGIVGASVTILGIMAAKSMNKSGYNVRLAAGTITAGGTLADVTKSNYLVNGSGITVTVPNGTVVGETKTFTNIGTSPVVIQPTSFDPENGAHTDIDVTTKQSTMIMWVNNNWYIIGGTASTS